MIDNIIVPLRSYDLGGFINGYRRFYASWSGSEEHANTSISVLDSYDGVPVPLPEHANPLAELMVGRKLFFQMHEPLTDEMVLCIDGKRRASGQFDIGIPDEYGFLLEVSENELHLQPALYDGSSGPMPSVSLQGTCSVLEKAMSEYAKRFCSS